MNSTGLPIYFSEQQIEMIPSKDGGETWSGFIGEFGPDGIEKRWTGSKTVAYRSERINNSPSAAILGENVVLAYGDNSIVILIFNQREILMGISEAVQMIFPVKIF